MRKTREPGAGERIAAMKVKQIQTAPSELQWQAALEDRHKVQKPDTSFTRHLSNQNEQFFEQRIKELTDRIQTQGEVVTKKADLAEFQKYRQLITELLNETVSNAYSFSQSERFDARGRHKVCTLIKKINGKLDEMAKEVLHEQADNLKLLNMVEDIRGMLVDMYM